MISPVLNKNIALCRMDVKYSDIGTKVEVGKIDGHQKRIEAKVDEIHEVIVKSKGALGAAFLILGAVWAIVMFLKNTITKILGLE